MLAISLSHTCQASPTSLSDICLIAIRLLLDLCLVSVPRIRRAQAPGRVSTGVAPPKSASERAGRRPGRRAARPSAGAPSASQPPAGMRGAGGKGGAAPARRPGPARAATRSPPLLLPCPPFWLVSSPPGFGPLSASLGSVSWCTGNPLRDCPPALALSDASLRRRRPGHTGAATSCCALRAVHGSPESLLKGQPPSGPSMATKTHPPRPSMAPRNRRNAPPIPPGRPALPSRPPGRRSRSTAAARPYKQYPPVQSETQGLAPSMALFN